MAFPNTFLRLTLEWQLPGGEVAQSSCSWDPSTALVGLDSATATALSGRADAFWGGIKLGFPAAIVYVGSKVSWIGTDGKTIASIEHALTGVPGTGDNPVLPNEVAEVISLRTAFAGRRTRGRMYLPPCSAGSVPSNGRIDAGFRGLVANGARDLMQPLTVGAETFTAVVASATGSVMTPIISVAVGDVPDVQRRRRDSLHEVYTVVAV